VIAGHAVPGPVVARRALGAGRYAAKIHGSDLEYAIRIQPRYAELAREGLEGAVAVTGSSDDALEALAGVVPVVARRGRRVPPGVEVERFRPAPRGSALLDVASRLDADPDTRRGRPRGIDRRVANALTDRDAEALDELARTYDQGVPDPDAAGRLRAIARSRRPLVGSYGKLILQKGVERVIEAATMMPEVDAVIVGFGLFREWLRALTFALASANADGAAWLRERGGMRLELGPTEISAHGPGTMDRVTFTGKLDHRYAPGVLAAMDVLVVPSTLSEAFGMVAAEGAAAGALPLVARHSGLAEVAGMLEAAVDRPGLFSFEPGDGATARLVDGVRALVGLPAGERDELRRAIRQVVAREWTWDRTAERLLEAATAPFPG
jgi:glycosyltransferase involved in cell wall biosynthesis